METSKVGKRLMIDNELDRVIKSHHQKALREGHPDIKYEDVLNRLLAIGASKTDIIKVDRAWSFSSLMKKMSELDIIKPEEELSKKKCSLLKSFIDEKLKETLRARKTVSKDLKNASLEEEKSLS